MPSLSDGAEGFLACAFAFYMLAEVVGFGSRRLRECIISEQVLRASHSQV